jgi:hypothetical protein
MAKKFLFSTKFCRAPGDLNQGALWARYVIDRPIADIPQSFIMQIGLGRPLWRPRQDEIAGRLRCSPLAARSTMIRPPDRSRMLAGSRQRHSWGNVLRICIAESTVPTQGRQALLKGCELTILAAEARIICAPRRILRLRARADSSYSHENASMQNKILMADLLMLR